SLSFFENVVGVQLGLFGNLIGHPVVQSNKGGMKLRNDNVFIISGISDQRPSGRIAIAVVGKHIAGEVRACELNIVGYVTSRQQFDSILLIHVRLIGGSAAVERVEIESRRTEIFQSIGIILALQAGGGIE